jgi:deoxycytidylate deaminase
MTESKYHGNPQIIRNMRDDLQKSITKTFITSDVFIHLEDSPNSEKTKWKDALESSESSESSEKTIPDKWQRTLERFIKIVFRDPLITPTADEHNMFMAHMAATSTADLSRQVGSVITNAHYDILATGANEVQKFGGGQYWPEEDYPDQRDFNFNGGVDTNAKLLNDLSRDVYDKILAVCEKNLSAVNDSYSNIGKDIGNIEEELIATIRRGTNVKDLTEYGRAVHAEMASITSAARNGIGLKGSLMYVTTYPCHNCAKHITASGIESVTYIEPYPKSKATHSHSDSISETPKDNYVLFKAFVGIGPNRFLDLFSLGLGNGEQIKRKNQDGNAIERNLDGKEPKFLLDVNVIKAAEGCFNKQIKFAIDIQKSEEKMCDPQKGIITGTFTPGPRQYKTSGTISNFGGYTANDYFFNPRNDGSPFSNIWGFFKDREVEFKIIDHGINIEIIKFTQKVKRVTETITKVKGGDYYEVVGKPKSEVKFIQIYSFRDVDERENVDQHLISHTCATVNFVISQYLEKDGKDRYKAEDVVLEI